MVEKKERMMQLCTAMLNEASVYIKGTLLNENYCSSDFINDKLYEVQIESVSRDETVTLYYADELEFCDSIYDVDEKEIHLTKE